MIKNICTRQSLLFSDMKPEPWINKNILISSMFIKTDHAPFFSWCPRGNKSLVLATEETEISQGHGGSISKVEFIDCDDSAMVKSSFQLSSK